MGLSKHKIGEFVKPFDKRCGVPNLSNYDVSGINREKEFFEPSKQVGEDTSKYKVVPTGYFACNLMHVGRDVVLPIALNHATNSKIVSPAYSVFEFIDNKYLLKDYFFLMLKSEERDRYFWFFTDSSVRDGMDWEVFCDLEVNLPSPKIQQKYVNIYNAMLANQQSYERGMEDIKLALDIELEKIKNNVKKEPLSSIIQELNERNIAKDIDNVSGVNNYKSFMPSVANGDDLSNYKIVRKNRFACNLMHIGRDKVIPVAMNDSACPKLVSPAYVVFEVARKDILPQYLMMWFMREETDRKAWFLCDSSVRSGMEKSSFFEMEIPIIDKEIQVSLIKLLDVYSQRQVINEKLKSQLKDICPILIKGSLEEGRRTKEA